jgi:putative transposase
LICRVLGVARSGFYAWLTRAPSARDLSEAWLVEEIRKAWKDSKKTYGSRRVRAELAHRGIEVGLGRVERLMRVNGLSGSAPRKRGRTTIQVPGVRPAPDLVERDFDPPAQNLLWSADITYLPSWEGWVYLAAVMDCFSRRIVGWSMAEHMRAELVVDALEMAVARRQPGPGLVHHSDQGSQYVALTFGHAAGDAGIAVSMGSVGDCFDNAVSESFFATLKKDLINRRSWPNKAELRGEVFSYIEEFYNPTRLHSRLGYLSPAAFEQEALAGIETDAGRLRRPPAMAGGR